MARRLALASFACAVAGCKDGTPAMKLDAPTADGDAGNPPALFAFVGGYSTTITRVSVENGVLVQPATTTAFAQDPSFLAIRPAQTNLYAVSESTSRAGAYAIDPQTAALTYLDDIDVVGNGPAHIAVDRGGNFVLVANYGNGTVSVAPILADGSLGQVQQTVSPGANAHQVVLDPSNRYAFVPCLGADRVEQYLFDAATGMLTLNATPALMTVAGAGPRHLAFAPDGTHAYLVNEKTSTLQALVLDTATGRLSSQQTISTRAAGATIANTGAEVWVHPNGKLVYASNRGDDNIAIFSSATGGTVTLVGHQPTGGQTPRMFALDPAGKQLYVANQNSNNVVTFVIGATTGMLAPSGSPVTVTSPSVVGFAALPR